MTIIAIFVAFSVASMTIIWAYSVLEDSLIDWDVYIPSMKGLFMFGEAIEDSRDEEQAVRRGKEIIAAVEHFFPAFALDSVSCLSESLADAGLAIQLTSNGQLTIAESNISTNICVDEFRPSWEVAPAHMILSVETPEVIIEASECPTFAEPTVLLGIQNPIQDLAFAMTALDIPFAGEATDEPVDVASDTDIDALVVDILIPDAQRLTIEEEFEKSFSSGNFLNLN